MRKTLYRTGWAVLAILPLFYLAEMLIYEDLPAVPLWKWTIPAAAALLVYLGRNKDDVLKHHVV